MIGIILIVMMLALVVLILYSALVVASREDDMSVSRWFYHVGVCDRNYCCGDCDHCDIMKNPEKYGIEEEDDD